MLHQNFKHVWVTERANRIADWLIFVAEIQPGNGLAGHLGVNVSMDNHNAVRIWVQEQMRTWPPQYRTLGELRKGFIACLPCEVF